MAYAEKKLDISVDNIDTLVHLSDEDFGSLIDAAVRGDLDERTERLIKDPRVIDRTWLALVGMKKSVEGQLGAKRAEYASQTSRPRPEWATKKYESQYKMWRAGALRFKSGVDQWLMTVRAERMKIHPGSEHITTYLRDERTSYLLAYGRLRDLVIEHRDHRCGPECDGDDGCVADHRLWSAISSDGRVARDGRASSDGVSVDGRESVTV